MIQSLLHDNIINIRQRVFRYIQYLPIRTVIMGLVSHLVKVGVYTLYITIKVCSCIGMIN